MKSASRAVKAERRSAQESLRAEIKRSRDEKFAEAHALRFFEEGVAASAAAGIGERILQPEGDGYDSITGDGATLHPFTKKKEIPRVIYGIPGGCHNRIKGEY